MILKSGFIHKFLPVHNNRKITNIVYDLTEVPCWSSRQLLEGSYTPQLAPQVGRFSFEHWPSAGVVHDISIPEWVYRNVINTVMIALFL